MKILALIYGLDYNVLKTDASLKKSVRNEFIVHIVVSILFAQACSLVLRSYSDLAVATYIGIGYFTFFVMFILQVALKHFWEIKITRGFVIFILTFLSLVSSIIISLIIFQNDIEAYHFGRNSFGRPDIGSSLEYLYMLLKSRATVLFIFILWLFFFEGILFLPFLIETARRSKIQLKETKIESKKTINNLFEKQVQAFSYVQHELGNKLPAVSNEFAFLRKLIAANSSNFTLTTKVRKPLGDEDPSTIDTVNDVLNRIEDGINYSIHALQNSSSVISANKQQLSVEEVNLQHFLKVICRKIISDTANVECQFTGDDDAIVNIDRSQFTTVINNIVTNAMDHGFDKMNTDKKIVFNVKSKKNKVELIIKNNGAPFNDSFTIDEYLTPHRYSGENGKSGMGGYFIGIILNKHNAKISLLQYEQDEEFKVKFLITFEKEA